MLHLERGGVRGAASREGGLEVLHLERGGGVRGAASREGGLEVLHLERGG